MLLEGKSLTEVTYIVRPYFPDKTELQVKEKVRNVRRAMQKSEQVHPIGVFSDPHCPFHHKGYLRFLVDTFKQFKVGRIVCTGDLVDFHALSRYEKETNAMSAYDEFDAAYEAVREFIEAFPEVDYIPGNHCERYIRQAKSVGIDKRFLKSYSELFGLPKGWVVHEDELIIDGVLYIHGINWTGKDGALNAAIGNRMSTVMGHNHCYAGVKYHANSRDLIFGMNVGCGINVDAYAFAYGKHAKEKPVLGCGIVYDSHTALFIPMGEKYMKQEAENGEEGN